MKIILLGEPKSTNHIYATMCRGSFPTRYMTPKGKQVKEDYQWQIKSQYMGKKSLKGFIKLKVDLYVGTKRKCDIDNFNKICYDSLTGIVWDDDSQIVEVTTRKLYDKLTPRIELEIKEL